MTVEIDGLFRHRREERHRQPIDELRILGFKDNPIGIPVDDFHTGERCVANVIPQRIGIRLHAEDIILQSAENRTGDARFCHAQELVDIIRRDEFARPCQREISDFGETLHVRFRDVVIEQFAVFIFRETGVRLIHCPRSDANFINGACNQSSGSIRWQGAARSIKIARYRHRFCCQRHEFVGPFQVVVLQRRFVNLLNKPIFVRTVGNRGIEVLRLFAERAVVDFLVLLGFRIGVVRHPASDNKSEAD